MLNISENSVKDSIDLNDFSASELLKKSRFKRLPFWLLFGLLVLLFSCLFLPWTQNVSTKGYVTTLLPEQRPQAVPSIIAGRLEQWFVREGDYVEAGDTIAFLSEVKSQYFDPELLERTSEQMNAKAQSVGAYDQKITALRRQYDAIQKSLFFKREQGLNKVKQARNKISIDSIDLEAYKANLAIAESQLERVEALHEKGLKSLAELQEKQYKLQNTLAKVNAQENKLLNQRNELLNLQLNLQSIENEYADKLAKSESERQSALSAKLESSAAASKLRSQLSNYSERQKYYYITSPQAGFITKTLKKGIGETVKEGTAVVTIMPANFDLAVEIYIKPQDLPLLNLGDHAQLRFDGWPAIVISGWPEASTGVFVGEIVAIDKFTNEDGYYRILVSPDKTQKAWPEKLSIGTGANAFILLNEVPIWYELWRQLNGFPADFYKSSEKEKTQVKRKAPLKSIK